MSRGLLWHYTDTAGLLGILNDQVLWASSCSFLNDPAEEHFAQNAMRLALGRLGRRSHPLGVGCEGYVSWDPDLRGAFSRRFVACATEARDALEVWRAYGPGSVPGTFALGLDPTVPLGLLSDHETASRERLPPLPSSWQRVRYWSVDEAAAWIEDELSTRLDARQRSASASTSRSDQAEGATFGDVDPHAWQDLDEVFTAVLACAKHRAYAAEREHRISLEVALQPPFPLRRPGPLRATDGSFFLGRRRAKGGPTADPGNHDLARSATDSLAGRGSSSRVGRVCA